MIFPIGSVLAVTAALREHYASIREHGTPLARMEALPSFDDFTKAVGPPEIEKLAQRFADPRPGRQGGQRRSRGAHATHRREDHGPSADR